MRALIDDYNSLLIKMRKETDEFNTETTEISTRLETLYREQLSKAWILIFFLRFSSWSLLKFLQATGIPWAAQWLSF